MIDLLMTLVITLSSIWVYFDATSNNIGRVPEVKGFTNLSAGAWALTTLFIWIIAFPLYMYKRKSLIETAKESPITVNNFKVKLTVLSTAAALMILSSLGNHLVDSELVIIVKGGELSICPNSTVEQMVDGFMDSPSWDSGTTESGVNFVNISGGITLRDKPVKGVIQFVFTDNANTKFKYNAFEINGVPQNNSMAVVLIRNMCKSATK